MINSLLMKKFVDQALTKLAGEWIIIGGTVLPLMGIDERITVDIDMINLKLKNSTHDTIVLMEIAENLKLPVESINQAGAYYLSKMTNIQKHLVLVKESKNCRIYRPDVFLFISLKIERLSESDLSDCLTMIKINPQEFSQFKKAIHALVKKSMKKAGQEKQLRMMQLLK